MIQIVRYVPDEDVEHVEAVDTMSRSDDPRLMNDAAAARKARERLLVFPAEDFHSVGKLLHQREATEHLNRVVLADRTASGFENSQNHSENRTQNHKHKSHHQLLRIY